ncbi:MAG: metal-dependent hydrolase [Candidatus Bathyarchaeota archaeon]|nr:MAG: metal-dependent hydrolase [Candidatus Bathyarchaeota archaeon]
MDSSEHAIIGAGVGFGGYLIFKNLKNEPLSLEGSILSLIGGAFFGLLPDILEPATNPNHRSFFHSMSLLLLIGSLNIKLFQNEKLTEEQKLFLSLISGSYCSHLIADSQTKKSLPLL